MARGGNKATIETEKLSSFITCPICLGCFRKPKLLPCIHSFCKVCLQQYVDNASTGGCFPCPSCRQRTQLPPNGVQGFRDNYFINSLQDELKAFPNAPSCDICRENSVTVRATSKCRECCDYLCEECSRAHVKTRYTSDHDVMPIDGEPSYTAPSDKISSKCEEHKNELVRYFCAPCQRLICRDCKALHHEGHKTLSFQDAVVGKRNEMGEEISKLSIQASEVKSSHQYLREIMEKEKKQRDKTLRDIVKKRDHLIQLITQAAGAAEDKVQTVSAGVLKARESELESINFQAAQLKSHTEYVELLMTKASDVEVLDNFTLVKNRSATLMSEHTNIGSSNTRTLEHTGSKTLDKEITKQFNLIEADIDLVKKNNNLETLPCTQDLSSNPGSRQRKVNQVVITKEREINNPGSRGITGISGISITTDTVFVCQGNRLYMRDTNTWTDVSDVYHIDGGAYDVSVYNNTIVVCKEGTDSKVQLMVGDISTQRHTSTLTLPFTSDCPFVVCGPSVGGQSTSYVTEYHTVGDMVVHHIDSKGNIIQTYGRGVLKNPYGIAVDVHGDPVVTDDLLKDVIIFNRDGSVKRHLRQHNNLSTDQLSRPWSVCVDQDGFIFVSSHCTNNVLLFSPTGDYIQTLLTPKDGLNQPTLLSVSPNRRLAVREKGGQRISIYKYTIRD